MRTNLISMAFLACLTLAAQAAKLPAPKLLSPANDAKNVASKPTLKWQKVDNAVAYSVRVLQGSRTITRERVTGTSLDLNLEYGVTYGWTVTALAKKTADNSNPSTKFTFTTSPAPLIPVLLSPANGASVPSTQEFFLSWQAIRDIPKYHFQYSLVPPSDSTPYVEATSARMGLFVEAGTHYYWRVRAVRKNGSVEPWSVTWEFTTSFPVVVLSVPAQNARNLEPTTYLAWNEVPGATRYEYEVYLGLVISPATQLAAGFVDENGSTLPTFVEDLLFKPSSTYTWRVRAWTAKGAGEWPQPAFTFSTTATPTPVPRILLPKNGANDVTIYGNYPFGPGPVLVQSSKVYLADSYTWQVFEGPLLNADRLLTETTVSNAKTMLTLDSLSQYTIRVAARIGGALGPWSDPVTFTTFRGTVNHVLSQSGSSQLKIWWDVRTQAIAYEVQLAGPTLAIIETRVVTEPQVAFSIKPGVTYSWRVRPLGKDGVTGDWVSGKM